MSLVVVVEGGGGAVSASYTAGLFGNLANILRNVRFHFRSVYMRWLQWRGHLGGSVEAKPADISMDKAACYDA